MSSMYLRYINGLLCVFYKKFRNIIDTTKKIAKARSDIFFLSKCKQNNVIPKGLIIKNPLQVRTILFTVENYAKILRLN